MKRFENEKAIVCQFVLLKMNQNLCLQTLTKQKYQNYDQNYSISSNKIKTL